MDPLMKRAKKFWNERQRRAPSGALTGYLLDESPPAIGRHRFEGEWRQLQGWLRRWPGPRDAALDVGCGTGIWLRALSGSFKKVEGWDYAPAMIRASRRTLKEAGLRHVALNCGEISSRKGRAVFDFILLGGVLMYTPDSAIDSLLKSLARLSRPGAMLIFRESISSDLSWKREGVALRPGLAAGDSKLDYVAMYRSMDDMKARLLKAGIAIEKISPNRHYKISDLTEDWLRRLDFLSGGRIKKNPALAEKSAHWIYVWRFILLYPEYFWRATLGLNRWKLENYWFICSSTQKAL